MTVAGDHGNLARWDRRTDAIRIYGDADGLPARQPMAFAEDRGGGLWIGLRGGGSCATATAASRSWRAEAGSPRARSAPWPSTAGAASGSRAAAAESPGSTRRSGGAPHFAVYGVAAGLSSANASSLALDGWDRVYVGTERGLDRLDPATGNVQRFTADDGLPRGVIETSLRDRGGDLWFGSVEGLSRLTPRVEPRRAPPAARIANVFVDGVRQPIPETGSTAVTLSPAGPGATSLQVDYVALDFAPGGRPRYQYRIDGLDSDWSAVTDQRSVVYARLPAGAYRFRVRALSNDGAVGDSGRVGPPSRDVAGVAAPRGRGPRPALRRRRGVRPPPPEARPRARRREDPDPRRARPPRRCRLGPVRDRDPERGRAATRRRRPESPALRDRRPRPLPRRRDERHRLVDRPPARRRRESRAADPPLRREHAREPRHRMDLRRPGRRRGPAARRGAAASDPADRQGGPDQRRAALRGDPGPREDRRGGRRRDDRDRGRRPRTRGIRGGLGRQRPRHRQHAGENPGGARGLPDRVAPVGRNPGGGPESAGRGSSPGAA